jgi:hypothetical protein
MLVAFAVTAQSPAGAQPAPPPAQGSAAQAEEHFQKGKALSKAGKVPEAYQSYLKAWELKKTYDIAGNLGSSELKLGKYRDAAVHLAYSIRNLPDTGSLEQRQRVQQLLDEAKAQVGTITVVVSIDGATVTLNGASIGLSPIADDQYVDPGTNVVVEAKRDGYKAVSQAIAATKGGKHEAKLILLPETGAAPVVAPPPPPPPTTEPQGQNPIPIIAGAAGAAIGIGLGVAFTVVSNGASSDADGQKSGDTSSCRAPATPAEADRCSGLKSSLEDTDTFANLAVGSFVIGGVLAVGTVAYVLFAPQGMLTTSTGGGPTGAGPVTITASPVMGPDGGGFFLKGTW